MVRVCAYCAVIGPDNCCNLGLVLQRPHWDNTVRFIGEMEGISEEYKQRAEEDGVYGILFPGYVKHDFQVCTRAVNDTSRKFPQ